MQVLGVRRAGGLGALLVALCTVSFAVFILLSPIASQAGDAPPWMAVAADYSLVLIGLFGLAVVPALAEVLAPLSPGWVRWTSGLAQLGFAVLAVVSVWQAEYEMTLTNASVGLPGFSLEDGVVPLPNAPEGYAHTVWQEFAGRAPKGWLEVSGVGLWMLTAGWLARGRNLFPENLNSVGRVAGALSFCTPLGSLLHVDLLLTLGILNSLVANPLWFAWTGWILLRSGPARPKGAPASPPSDQKTRGLAYFLHRRLDRRPSPHPEAPAPPVDSSLN